MLWMVFVLCSVRYSSGDNPNLQKGRHCEDLNPQPHVDIEQLMGMWYVIEVISHVHRESAQVENEMDTCPVIYISEDKSSTTMLPVYKSYLPGKPYGTGQGSTYSEIYGNPEYREATRNPPYQIETRKDDYSRYGTRRRQHQVKQKHMQIVWVEARSVTDYSVYYTNRPSVWFSSGPHNGSSLPTQLDVFAGVIQVIKAVGNHLVLTFCYRLPEPDLSTVLLSRVHKLDQAEVNGVHNLLTRKQLELTHIRKTCRTNGASGFGLSFLVAAVVASLKVFEHHA